MACNIFGFQGEGTKVGEGNRWPSIISLLINIMQFSYDNSISCESSSLINDLMGNRRQINRKYIFFTLLKGTKAMPP